MGICSKLITWSDNNNIRRKSYWYEPISSIYSSFLPFYASTKYLSKLTRLTFAEQKATDTTKGYWEKTKIVRAEKSTNCKNYPWLVLSKFLTSITDTNYGMEVWKNDLARTVFIGRIKQDNPQRKDFLFFQDKEGTDTIKNGKPDRKFTQQKKSSYICDAWERTSEHKCSVILTIWNECGRNGHDAKFQRPNKTSNKKIQVSTAYSIQPAKTQQLWLIQYYNFTNEPEKLQSIKERLNEQKKSMQSAWLDEKSVVTIKTSD